MSFLLEDETQATLAEALAFIDTFAQDEPATSSANTTSKEPSARDSALYVELRIPKSSDVLDSTNAMNCDASSSGHTSGTDSSTSSSAADALSDEQLKKLKARAANTRAVHRYRKRTKTEIVTLREQVEQLDTQLTALRKRDAAVRGTTSALPLQVSASSLSALTTVVATELRKRQASEALNRRLKEALAKQRKVSSALESVFKKQTLAPDLSFVLDMDKLLPPPLAAAAPTNLPAVATAASDDARVYAELYRYLEDTVYAGTPAISALLARSDVDCVFNNTLIKHDARVGKMFEFLSNTPVGGSREQLTAKLWMFLTFPIGPNEAAEDPFANVRMCYEPSNSVSGQVGMKFDCDLGDLTVTGVSAFRQFVEPHRTVLTFASLLSVPGTALLFRESAWLILSDAAAAGCTSAPTLFQTAYRLHAEPSTTSTEDASETRATTAAASSNSLVDTVLTRKGERMRGFLMMIQNRLLNGLRELRLDDFLPKCMRLCPCSA